jgi:hypothetical protein
MKLMVKFNMVNGLPRVVPLMVYVKGVFLESITRLHLRQESLGEKRPNGTYP